MRDALPPGNVKEKSPSSTLYTTVSCPAPAYARFVHETPDCSSLRLPGVGTKSTKVRPVNLSMVMMDVGAKVTETITFAAFATDEDTPTVEPLIVVEKMAGNDPCELAAITLSEASRMEASTASLLGRELVGRLKVPNDNVSRVLADMLAPKTTSISEDVPGLTREEEIMLTDP
jgi:hypothetical protein